MIVSSVSAEPAALRQETLDAARGYRASWVRLAQYLLTVHKDKHFKHWGFMSFETYCVKELKLKQAAVSKLMKSYSFLEKEEPSVVRESLSADKADSSNAVPNYESVNLLRLARQNQKLSVQDFSDLRQAVIEKAEEPKEIRMRMKKIIDDKIDYSSPDVKREQRNARFKRMISLLQTSKREMEKEKMLPAYLAKQVTELIAKLEDQIE